jgi:hypothetical protein
MVRLLRALLILPLSAAAADNTRISFLEQEVRNVQRQLAVLSRQVDGLTAQPNRPVSQPAEPRAAAPVADSPQWLNAAKWRELRPGMSELEVLSALGPPTSMRAESGARVLLYAMEIGTAGFLGGSVKLRDRAVVEVLKPTLQ